MFNPKVRSGGEVELVALHTDPNLEIKSGWIGSRAAGTGARSTDSIRSEGY
jgi:hypothetical protein